MSRHLDGPVEDLTGDLRVEFHPTGTPIPKGYGVFVAGRLVATLSPEVVDRAHREFTDMAAKRAQFLAKAEGG